MTKKLKVESPEVKEVTGADEGVVIKHQSPIYLRLSDEPVVVISGVTIPVIKCDPPAKTLDSCNFAINSSGGRGIISPVGFHNRGDFNYSVQETTTPKELTWYKASLAGYSIYLTNGSQLTVNNRISKDDTSTDFIYEEVSSNVTVSTTELIMIASDIKCEVLNIDGKVLLNNSRFNVKNSLTIAKSTLAGVVVASGDYCYITDSNLSYFNSRGVKVIEIVKSYIDTMELLGVDKLVVKDTQVYGEFKFTTWGRGISPGQLNLIGVRLNGVAVELGYLEDDAVTEINSTPSYSKNRGFMVERAIDIGNFSGKKAIPFVRLGKNDIVVKGEVFLASEFYPINDRDASVIRKQPVEQPQPYGGYRNLTPFQPSFEFGLPGPNTPLWNRALKVLYPETYKTIVPGKMGEMLVSTLLEQIRSRINIFTEYNALSDKQD